MVDPDKKLREALKLKGAMIMKCTNMCLEPGKNKFDKPQLKVVYVGDEGNEINEAWTLSNKTQKHEFLKRFINPHLVNRHHPFTDSAPTKVANKEHRLRPPEIVIARKMVDFRLFETRCSI